MDITIFNVIIAALLAVSEALSFIPNVQSNGIFQMLWNLFKILGGEVKEEDQA
jgi:hypothetical protein